MLVIDQIEIFMQLFMQRYLLASIVKILLWRINRSRKEKSRILNSQPPPPLNYFTLPLSQHFLALNNTTLQPNFELFCVVSPSPHWQIKQKVHVHCISRHSATTTQWKTGVHSTQQLVCERLNEAVDANVFEKLFKIAFLTFLDK